MPSSPRRVVPALLFGALAGAPSLATAESPALPPIAAVDLLIVVDSRAELEATRAELAAALPGFLADLDVQTKELDGLSAHVAVVTADLGAGALTTGSCIPGGDEGRMHAEPHDGVCSAPDAAFLAAGYGTDENVADLGGAAACIVPRADTGCAFQQPLRAITAALGGTNPDNAGFLRPDSVLAVLILAGQDDCSADPAFFAEDTASLGPATPLRCARHGWTCTPPIDGTAQVHTACTVASAGPLDGLDGLADELRALRADPRKIAVQVLRGPTLVEVVGAGDAAALRPSCGEGTALTATPGLRLTAFAEKFPAGSFGSACGNFELPLAAFADDILERVQLAPLPPPPPVLPDAGPSPDTYGASTAGGGSCATGTPGPASGVLLLALIAGARRRRRR